MSSLKNITTQGGFLQALEIINEKLRTEKPISDEECLLLLTQELRTKSTRKEQGYVGE